MSAFLSVAAPRASALVLEGDAGAGKTTLWLAAIRLARASGWRVLEARAVEAEALMAFTGIGDLMHDVLDEVLDAIPAPQSDALRVALLQERPSGAPPDERAVGLGMLNALCVLGAGGPVLVALDDVQWLDPASAIVLAFAWRRLREAPVQLLATRRTGAPLVADVVGDGPAQRISVGPLSLGAVHRLLHTRLELVLTRPALRRVHEVSGGNPFFALELGRALQRHAGAPAPAEPLPVPDRLGELLRDRLGALPTATRDALAVVAAVAQPTRALVTVATGDEVSLEPAFASNVLVTDGNLLRFTHPLRAATAYEALGATARRTLHARLSVLVDDPEQRARHMALAATGPDAAVAHELELAAAHARAHGSTATAAELMEQASRLTSTDRAQDRQRRTVAAGRLSFAAGDALRARRLLEDAVGSARSGQHRAEARIALGRLLLYEGEQRSAANVCAEALREPGVAAAARADAGAMLGAAQLFMREDLAAAARQAAAAAELSRRTTDRELRANATSMSALLQVVVGSPTAFRALEEAESYGELSDAHPVIAGPSFHRALMLLWTDGAQVAAPLLTSLLARARARGDEASLPLILTETAIAEYLNGRWTAAAGHSDDAYQLALQTGQRSQEAFALAVSALVGAAQGRTDQARENAADALAIADGSEMAVARIHAEWALATLELSLGQAERVADRLGELRRRQLSAGVGEPGLVPFMADEAEAAIALGRMTEAETVLGWLEERGRALGRASALGGAARGRALLSGARGELGVAIREGEIALTEHQRAAVPFETARTLLTLGRLRRRARQRTAARETLEQALSAFERLGATSWAACTRADLARIGGRKASTSLLTATERRIAELVAEGMTNKEIAATLFVTAKTVETQLSRMYKKCGVHSRTALARHLGDL